MNLDQKTAQQIWDKHHLGKIQTFKKESLGITGSVFSLNQRFILKIGGANKQDKFRVERNALMCEILERNKIKAPQVVALDTSKKIIKEKYLIMTRLAGDDLSEVWEKLPGNVQQSIAVEYGEIMAKIHQIKMQKFGDIVNNNRQRDSWHQFIMGRYRKYLEYLERNNILPARMLVHVHGVIDDNNYLFRITSKPVLLHVDFKAKNIKYYKGRINGIFDFDECLGGHNEFDFTKIFLPYTIDRRYKEMIINSYKRIGRLSEEFICRVRLYSLGFLLNVLWFSHLNNLITPALKAKYIGSLYELLGETSNV